jgi:hypothetical protein
MGASASMRRVGACNSAGKNRKDRIVKKHEPVEAALAEALYATNRAIARINEAMEGASHWSRAEKTDYDKLVAGRDHVWAMLQKIDPKEWRD